LAVITVPSSSNSITAWDLPMASICPWNSASRALRRVMSVANLTILQGLPAASRIGL
jgi:hypothetical protein